MRFARSEGARTHTEPDPAAFGRTGMYGGLIGGGSGGEPAGVPADRPTDGIAEHRADDCWRAA